MRDQGAVSSTHATPPLAILLRKVIGNQIGNFDFTRLIEITFCLGELCDICARFPSVRDAHLRLAERDALAESGVLRHGISNGLSLEGDFPRMLVDFLSDFRKLVQHHHILQASLLAASVSALAPKFERVSNAQTSELIYLVAEYVPS